MKPLRIVSPEPSPKPIDLYAPIKAMRESIDWERVHIRGDRAEPIDLVGRVSRVWRR